MAHLVHFARNDPLNEPLVVLPSTVLLRRERMPPVLWLLRPVPLSVMVESETRMTDVLMAVTPSLLLEETQFSRFSSPFTTASKPTLLCAAVESLTVARA